MKGTLGLHCMRSISIPSYVDVQLSSCFCSGCYDGSSVCDKADKVPPSKLKNIYGKNQPVKLPKAEKAREASRLSHQHDEAAKDPIPNVEKSINLGAQETVLTDTTAPQSSVKPVETQSTPTPKKKQTPKKKTAPKCLKPSRSQHFRGGSACCKCSAMQRSTGTCSVLWMSWPHIPLLYQAGGSHYDWIGTSLISCHTT